MQPSKILFIILLFSYINDTNAQHVTRLIGYEETSLDTFGAKIHYKAYWNNYSGNRGSVVTPHFRVGWVNYQYPEDISAPDTTFKINRHFGTSSYEDSSMIVWVYNANNNPVESKQFTWDFSKSKWLPNAKYIDSFFYASNRLIERKSFQYFHTLTSHRKTVSYTFTYDTNGKLIVELQQNYDTATQIITTQTRYEYDWTGNNMTDERAYTMFAGHPWLLNVALKTTYVNGNPVTHTQTGWTHLHGVATPYGIRHDSNIYAGSRISRRDVHLSGYATAKYKINFRTSYQYDINGSVTQVINEAIDTFGIWKNTTKKEYKYNSDNELVLITNYDWSAGAWTWTAPWRGNINTQEYHYFKKPTSINNMGKADFSIYPSPASHSLNITTSFESKTDCVISIISLDGKLSRQWTEVIGTGNVETNIPVNSLSEGNYFLRLTSSEGTSTKKFVIIR